MARAKKITTSNPIALQLSNYEKKIEEFQEYMTSNDVRNILDPTQRHDEIKIHVLLMKELPTMLESLKRLLAEDIEKEKEVRGEKELSPLEKKII